MSVTGARVLIVEDDKTQRDLLARVFSRDGFVVSTASDGTEALRLLDDTTPDLLVLDLMLPWVNGIEILATVRRHPRLARGPVLVATGSATSAYDLRDYGPLCVFHKPFELSTLLPAAEKLLDGSG